MAANSVFAPLEPCRPFVLQPQYQVCDIVGLGLCNEILALTINGAKPYRYALGAYRFETTATPGVVTLEGGSSFTVGGAAATEQAAPAVNDNGLFEAANLSDTDLTAGGGFDHKGLFFLHTGIAFSPERPFQRGADNQRVYSDVVSSVEDGQLAEHLMQLVITRTHVTVDFGERGVTQRAALAQLHPHWGGERGSRAITLGEFSSISYLPWNAAVLAGPAEEGQQMTVTCTIETDISVDSGGVDPTEVEGVSEADSACYAPLRVVFVGYIVCLPDAMICGIPMMAGNGLRMGMVARRNGGETPP